MEKSKDGKEPLIQEDLSQEIGSPGKEGIQDGGSNEAEERTKFFTVLRFIRIEPLLFAFVFAHSMNLACLTNMMMDKGCRYQLNFTEEVCGNLSGHNDEKIQVEILANDYSLYSKLLNLVGAAMMVFVAPFSDKYGRKLPIIVTCALNLVGDVAYMMCALHFHSRLEFLLLAKLPSELFGGFICILTMVFSHASEVSSERTRVLKYTAVEIALGLGMSLGMVSGGMLYKYCGYVYVYVAAAVLHAFCLPWAAFFVPETRGIGDTTTCREKLLDFFTLENIKAGWKAAVRPRPNLGRLILWLMLFSMCLVVLTYESYGSVGFVYVHHVFNWDAAHYSVVTTVFSTSQMFVMFLTAPILIKVLKTPDNIIGIIGVISIMFKNFFIAFSRGHTYLYYVGLALGYWTGFASLALRTRVSKISEKHELGRVFAFLAILEGSFPILGTACVTKLFNATLDVFPSIGYLAVVLLMLLPLATFIFAHFISRISKTIPPPPPYPEVVEKF